MNRAWQHLLRGQRPYRLVFRTSRCDRDNPGSTPGVVISEKFWYSYTQSQLYYNLRIQISLCFFMPGKCPFPPFPRRSPPPTARPEPMPPSPLQYWMKDWTPVLVETGCWEGARGHMKRYWQHLLRGQRPHRLVVRTSRCGRDNPDSTPGVVIF